MAGELAYDPGTGQLVYSPATGQLAKNCLGTCEDNTCADAGHGNAVVSVDECGVANCICVEDTYAYVGGSDPLWNWLGGFCDWPGWGETDFQLLIECVRAGEHQGEWRVKIVSAVGGIDVFDSYVSTGDLGCDGADHFAGEFTIAGVDATGDGGPDCSACTATVTL